MSSQVPFVAGAIVKCRVASLVPYARNARTHSDEQVEQLCASIREFGFTNPILIDGRDGGIIAGHGRILAAQKLGLTEVPCIDLSHLSAEQRRAYILADNKIALNAGWDLDLLGGELRALSEVDFDLALTGFDTDELAELLNPPSQSERDPEETPEPPAEPVSRLGDVWRLGRHRLVCGDSTDADAVAKALNGVTPHLMVTDPPYGVEYDANWRNQAKRPDGTPYGASAVGKVANDDRADWREAWALFPGDVAYVWHSGTKGAQVAESLLATGFEIRAQIVWAKNNMVISRGHYHPQHEPLFYAARKGRTGHWSGDRKQTTLWQIDKPQKSETGHSTQKPVECMKRPIENNSSPGQAIYDPFLGSGTTLIAAEMTGRACHAIELSPAYVDVAVCRWQEFAGAAATLEGDGRSFDAVAIERRPKAAA